MAMSICYLLYIGYILPIIQDWVGGSFIAIPCDQSITCTNVIRSVEVNVIEAVVQARSSVTTRHSERHGLHSAWTIMCMTKHMILNDALEVIHKQAQCAGLRQLQC